MNVTTRFKTPPAPAAEPVDPVSQTPVHMVRFMKNAFSPDLWKSECSCGWTWVGTEAEVQTRASRHDIEWEIVP